MKTLRKKIGILGGTFDPPHRGHLEISKKFLEKFKLNNLIWAVTKKNPFKNKPLLSLDKRILLSKKMTKFNKKILIRNYDKVIKSTVTINLIKYLKKRNKNVNYYFLMGSDNLINLHLWQNWKNLAKQCQIVVFPRRGYLKKSIKSKAFKILGNDGIMFIKSRMLNISSSKIRKKYNLD